VNAWPYVVIVVLLVGMLLLSFRRRKRQVAEEMLRATSGLYGTVVAKSDDGTVLLSVAPGVEVKWASAALRDAASLADAYRRPLQDDSGDTDDSAGVELRKTEEER
jgi:preprotein translocase subunit YajC